MAGPEIHPHSPAVSTSSPAVAVLCRRMLRACSGVGLLVAAAMMPERYDRYGPQLIQPECYRSNCSAAGLRVGLQTNHGTHKVCHGSHTSAAVHTSLEHSHAHSGPIQNHIAVKISVLLSELYQEVSVSRGICMCGWLRKHSPHCL
jgi:hypothetical protein